MKFKVGDKVKVKSIEEIKKLPHHQIYNEGEEDEEVPGVHGECKDTDEFGNVITAHNSFIDSMYQYCGKEFIVEEACGDGNYKLKNACKWSFIACWLERVQHYVESFDEE